MGTPLDTLFPVSLVTCTSLMKSCTPPSLAYFDASPTPPVIPAFGARVLNYPRVCYFNCGSLFLLGNWLNVLIASSLRIFWFFNSYLLILPVFLFLSIYWYLCYFFMRILWSFEYFMNRGIYITSPSSSSGVYVVVGAGKRIEFNSIIVTKLNNYMIIIINLTVKY